MKTRKPANEPWRCDTCDWTGREEQCNPARDLHERIDVGGPYTHLECPNCGALVYPAEPQEEGSAFYLKPWRAFRVRYLAQTNYKPSRIRITDLRSKRRRTEHGESVVQSIATGVPGGPQLKWFEQAAAYLMTLGIHVDGAMQDGHDYLILSADLLTPLIPSKEDRA